MKEKQACVNLPAHDCDVLWGFHQIARYFGLGVGAVRHRAEKGEILVHRLPGRQAVIAFKSENMDHLRKLVCGGR